MTTTHTDNHEHESGQLALIAPGDQLALVPLPDTGIPTTGDMAAPGLEEPLHYQRIRCACGETTVNGCGARARKDCGLHRDEPQYRVWLESKEGTYWVPGQGADEHTVRANLTRTQRKRLRKITQVTTREETK